MIHLCIFFWLASLALGQSYDENKLFSTLKHVVKHCILIVKFSLLAVFYHHGLYYNFTIMISIFQVRSIQQAVKLGVCNIWYSSEMHLNTKSPGPWFSIKMASYQCRKSHCGDKTVVRPSYLHNGISYTGKMAFYIESGPRNLVCP